MDAPPACAAMRLSRPLLPFLREPAAIRMRAFEQKRPKESIEISSGIASRLGMGIQNVTEFLCTCKRACRIVAVMELGQSIPNDPTNEACRIGHQLGEMFSISSSRLLPALAESYSTK